jgi:hypothetical protein
LEIDGTVAVAKEAVATAIFDTVTPSARRRDNS